jgi:hypothetical protein
MTQDEIDALFNRKEQKTFLDTLPVGAVFTCEDTTGGEDPYIKRQWCKVIAHTTQPYPCTFVELGWKQYRESRKDCPDIDDGYPNMPRAVVLVHPLMVRPINAPEDKNDETPNP